jgi:hypothetical protein
MDSDNHPQPKASPPSADMDDTSDLAQTKNMTDEDRKQIDIDGKMSPKEAAQAWMMVDRTLAEISDEKKKHKERQDRLEKRAEAYLSSCKNQSQSLGNKMCMYLSTTTKTEPRTDDLFRDSMACFLLLGMHKPILRVGISKEEYHQECYNTVDRMFDFAKSNLEKVSITSIKFGAEKTRSTTKRSRGHYEERFMKKQAQDRLTAFEMTSKKARLRL